MGTAAAQATEYDLFLVFADQDQEWVERVLLKLLALPPERMITLRGLRPGANKMDEVERAVLRSRFCVLVLTPDFVAGVWPQYVERIASFQALLKQKSRLIPLWLKDCAVPQRLETVVELKCQEDSQWEPEIARLRSALEIPLPEPAPPHCPYVGMRPFETAQAAWFAGRSGETRTLAQRLEDQRFVLVVGPAGCGKTSLIQAGLIPLLRETAAAPWLVIPIRPKDRPLRVLAEALGASREELERWAAAPESVSPPDSILRLAGRKLVVVDPLEECFSPAAAESTKLFAVLKALRQLRDWYAVFAMREEYGPELEAAGLRPLERLALLLPRRQDLRDMVLEPAERAGLYVEPELVERLVDDAAREPGPLPLLQEVLVSLWEDTRGRGLTLDSYRRISENRSRPFDAILERIAAAAYNELSDPQRRLARRVFLRLVQFGEGRSNTRRQQPLAALAAAGDPQADLDQCMGILSDRRLVILQRAGGGSSVDLSHEAILNAWPELAQWLTRCREAELYRRALEARAGDWAAAGRPLDACLGRKELRAAEEWLAQHRQELGASAEMLALVAASHSRQKRLKFGLAGMCTLVLALAGFAGMQWYSGSRQTTSRKHAKTSEDFARQGAQAAAAWWALKAAAESRTPEALRALALAAQFLAPAAARFEAPVWRLAFSPNGARLAASSHSEVRLWREPWTGEGSLLPHGGAAVLALAFHPGGDLLALADAAGLVSLWRFSGGWRREPCGGAGPAVNDLAFVGPGDMLLGGRADGSLAVWNTGGPCGNPVRTLQAFNGEIPVRWVASSQDGKWLACAGGNGEVRLLDAGRRDWGWETLESLPPPQAGDAVESPEPPAALGFSPDGNGVFVAGGFSDRRVRFWGLNQRREIAGPTGEMNSVTAAAYEPATGWLATVAAGDREIKLWDVPGSNIARRWEFLSEVTSFSFQPGGGWLAVVLRVRTPEEPGRATYRVLTLPLDPDKLAAGVRERFSRLLPEEELRTPENCRVWFGGPHCPEAAP